MNDRDKKINGLLAFSDIDESLISEAMEKMPRRRSLLGFAAAALIVTAAAAALSLLLKGKGGTKEASLPTQIPVTIESDAPAAASEPNAEATAFITETLVTEYPSAAAETEKPEPTVETGTNAPAASQTPEPTEKTTSKPTSTPQATQRVTPKPTSKTTATPQATEGPKPTPTSKPTATPRATEGPKPTGTPKTYTYYSEEEFISAVRGADESDGLLYGIDRYYVPAYVPDGAELERIRVSQNSIALRYAAEEGEYEFAWLRGQEPEEYFSTLDILHHGGWHGEFYIAESSYMKVFREQYGSVFYARLPLGSAIELIESFCDAVEKDV